MNEHTAILDQLIEPEKVPFTLDAPGWYVIGGIVLVLLMTCVYLLVRKYVRNRYRRVALKQLQQQENTLKEQKQYTELIYDANRLMKEICVTKYDRETCASLRSAEWLHFLNETARKDIFRDTDSSALESVYLCDSQPDERIAMDFAAKTKQWIKKHQHAVAHRK